MQFLFEIKETDQSHNKETRKMKMEAFHDPVY